MYTSPKILKKLANYCSYQDRSHWEVRQKLKESYFLADEEKEEIIVWLIQNNFLNEERFARSYSRGKFYQKKWGKAKIIQNLKQKEISDKLIKIGLSEINEEEYNNTLKNLAEKKWKTLTDENIFIKKRKLSNYLLQKGYESSLIYNLLEDY